MSDRIAPAQKPVPRKDGFKSGSANANLSTPVDNEGKVWQDKKGASHSIFHKPAVH